MRDIKTMTNTYFVLSDKLVSIKRLHICTWERISYNAGIEIGIEFEIEEPSKDITFKISLPFVHKGDKDKVRCLMEALVKDDDNSKFIFNDTIKTNKHIKENKQNGTLLEFGSRESLSVLPIKDICTEDGLLSFSVKEVRERGSNYIRLYIPTRVSDLSVIRIGIAKTTHIYDIKINEKRNLPAYINNLINEGYKICDRIGQCFCFHVIPSSYNISYLNGNKLKNIRMLEADAFNRYLSFEPKVKNNDYIIVFNKVEEATGEKKGTFTFFSVFEEETIGNRQIVLAIGANISCSLLFGISSKFIPGDKWYEPYSFWIAIIILLVFLGWLFIPWKKIRCKIRK